MGLMIGYNGQKVKYFKPLVFWKYSFQDWYQSYVLLFLARRILLTKAGVICFPAF
jgi:hypothetical protein